MAHNFLVELQKIDNANKYTIICSNESYNRSAISAKNFSVIAPLRMPGSKLVQRIYNKIWRSLLPLRLRLLNADCYFSFHNMTLPPISVAKRMVVFNLDLIPIVLSGYESIHHKSKTELVEEYKQVAKRADHVISISEFSKKELCQELGVEEERVSVVHLAVSPDFVKDLTLSNKTLEPKRYLLTIGGTEPRKNVDNVVHAFSQLSKQLQERFPLVVIGGEWHGIKLDSFKAHPNVVCLGYVKEQDLPGLYKNAKAFIFASEYEGFGFTILEAMATGTPVISATGSSLDEVAGNATLTFDPKNSQELSQRINQVLVDSELELRLIASGKEQNERFSWEKSAKKLYEIITLN
jgi:glycosyltransferase involved in cell wall biosynthesis